MTRLLLLCIAILSTQASAADWQVFEKHARVSSWIDRSSHSHEDTVYSAWIKDVHTTPQRLRRGAGAGMYDQTLELVHMNCASRRFSIEKSVHQRANGSLVIETTHRERYTPVVPDSPAEARYKALCGPAYGKLHELRDKGVRFVPLDADRR